MRTTELSREENPWEGSSKFTSFMAAVEAVIGVFIGPLGHFSVLVWAQVHIWTLASEMTVKKLISLSVVVIISLLQFLELSIFSPRHSHNWKVYQLLGL